MDLDLQAYKPSMEDGAAVSSDLASLHEEAESQMEVMADILHMMDEDISDDMRARLERMADEQWAAYQRTMVMIAERDRELAGYLEKYGVMRMRGAEEAERQFFGGRRLGIIALLALLLARRHRRVRRHFVIVRDNGTRGYWSDMKTFEKKQIAYTYKTMYDMLD